MRGTNSNHVKVLINGIDVSDPTNPNRSFDFGQLLTTDIAQVEVLRGPRSGLYGANALGGVIAVTTRRAMVRQESRARKKVGRRHVQPNGERECLRRCFQLLPQSRSLPFNRYSGDAFAKVDNP